MSKNTRWALALIGVVIIIVGAVVIGTGSDNTDAVQEPSTEATAETGPTQSAPATPPTGSTGPDNGGGSGDNGDQGNGTGGASPSNPDSGQGSGGAIPGQSPDSSGGAEARVGVVSPVLAAGKVRTIKVEKGQTVMIRATSTTTGEMHVHGYDKEIPLKPGEIVRVKFKATIDGEFPIEFHLPAGDHADVGILRVSP